MTTSYTDHFNIPVPDFNTRPWHQTIAQSFDRIDAVIWQNVFSANVVLWENSLVVTAGQTAIDGLTGQFWTSLVNHTTSATPTTFAGDRAAFPAYWAQASTVPEYQGEWLTTTAYVNNDFVSNTGVYYVCKVTHIAGVFATDLANGYWNVVIDPAALTAAVDAADADVVLTNADVVTVAADKAIVAADKATVAADKAIVIADMGTVAADKAIVIADMGTVAADKAIVAADKGTVAADKATVAANLGLTNADVVLTHADVVLTHADVITTNADAATATAQAAIATDAAASMVNVMTLVGSWDASTGAFPNTTGRKKGWTYVCTVSGTVDGVQFGVDDKLTALVDTASTTTYVANWFKIEGGTIVSAQVTAALGYTPVTNARTISAGGIATGGGNLTADRTITVTKATGAEITAGVNDTNAVTPKALADAGVNVPATTPAGRVRIGYFTAADTGWVLLNDGTFGNAGSGATYSGPEYEAVYTAIFNSTANTECAVSTGRGASAAFSFAAGKTIAQPKVLGRALGVAGSGSGLTTRAIAKIVGEETHTPTLAEMYAHTHTSGVSGGTYPPGLQPGSTTVPGGAPTGSAGSSSPFNVMSPITFMNAEIKL